MKQVITFKTAMFDVTTEPKNPINPIYGQSLLVWLKEKISSQVVLSEPDTEDWGWCSLLDWNGQKYLVGAATYFEKGDNLKEGVEWLFQVDKQRSFIETILGRGKMSCDDECFQFFKSLFEQEEAFNNVHVE